MINRMAELRPLNSIEQAAVINAYFAARAALAPFTYIFGNFGEAVDRLIHEPEEHERFEFFQNEFARFIKRCHIISKHLAEHVEAATRQESREGPKVAWRILRNLYADENITQTDWEDDSGAVPQVSWLFQPNGGAFAAILGLTGTGLHGKFTSSENKNIWEEVRGPLSAFGNARNEWNAPIPAVLPALGFTLSAAQLKLATLHNGFAMRNVNGQQLGGAQPFTVKWSGVLLIEHPGSYQFYAGAPTPAEIEPNFEAAEAHRWRVTLRRGQKTWFLLNHHWTGEDAPAAHSAAIGLRQGAYEIKVEFAQPDPIFSKDESVVPVHSGFQVKYTGPDSDDRLIAIPYNRLFRDKKDAVLGKGLGKDGAGGQYLNHHYTSTLRDIRRTYQRAFKAILFAHRFCLSAKPARGEQQSEIGFMLESGKDFLGTSYYRTSPAQFNSHHAFFNFNFLPVSDPYLPPQPTQDQRVQPSAKRSAALFDWWERTFDYCQIRNEAESATERSAWLLFFEATERQQDLPAQLSRHLGVDIRHSAQVLNYFAHPTYTITDSDLSDERWVMRVWQAEKWLQKVQKHFASLYIGDARPELWASDDPGNEDGAPPLSGNENLTQFYQNGCFENGDPRRHEDLKQLNDGLRQRARAALLAYLCGMERVSLPWGGGLFAHLPHDLSDLLLLDVEAGIREKASRVEDIISSIHTFLQRARLGLEPDFTVTPTFVQLLETRFATYHTWEICKKREVYRENWIEWDELEVARHSEAFRFLEDKLRLATMTKPTPGGMEWWPNYPTPPSSSLTDMQKSQPSQIQLLQDASEGLNLLGMPESAAWPTWLARIISPNNRGNGDDNQNPIINDQPAVHDNPLLDEGHVPPAPAAQTDSGDHMPLWIQSAVRLGTRFIRIAAAGVPPASTSFVSDDTGQNMGCCEVCGQIHSPVMDEYYFWLEDSRYFNPVSQNADTGADLTDDPANSKLDPTSDWHRPDKLPGLLNWSSDLMVQLYWCRVHNGEFMQPRRSDEGLLIDPDFLNSKNPPPQLDFKGRTADSLRFMVTGGKTPTGYLDTLEPGFRFDIASDSAVVLPQVDHAALATDFPGGLTASPYFAYFAPGTSLEPPKVFSVALTIAATLRTQCRYEPALKWYELAFNPLKRDNTWAVCPIEDQDQLPANDVTCCPSDPANDGVARNRSVTLYYLETLLQWGDALQCRKNSPEYTSQAVVIFDAIERVLGVTPVTTMASDNGITPMTVATFIPVPAPLNPRLLSLYERTTDRLASIHHNQNAHRLRNGRTNLDISFWGSDPFRDGWQTNEDPCQDDDCISCCSPYRFNFRIQKAIEFAGFVRTLGSELASAFEKGDAEYLSSIRSTHERQLAQLTLEVRQNEWREADWQVQALEITKKGAQSRKAYFERLISGKLNAGETDYLGLTGVSTESRAAGNISEAVGQGMTYVPDIGIGGAGLMGTPLEITGLPLGNKLATNFFTMGRIMNWLAEIAGTGASVSMTLGNWDRRDKDWRNEVTKTEFEIEDIKRKILAMERSRDMKLQGLNNHQRQLEQSIEMQEFLRDKFTKNALYLFLQQETAALHYQAYKLAMDTALLAEQAFHYERGDTTQRFLPEENWDSLHEGLLAGQRLELALRQMETAYLDTNCREYELTKHISLRLNFPLAFLQLITTGSCEVEIPEWMFDLDYPSHYMRRIKNITLTIPCIVGPYTGVHCRLTLLSSITRVDPRLIEPATACCPDQEPNDGYQPLLQDARIVKQYGATEAIATSNGQNDSGLFELNFHDERYLPFEFAGAVSRWRIELRQENNQFDIASNVSDAILLFNYTSREAGEPLRKAANDLAQWHLRRDGIRMFDIKHDLPEVWQVLQSHVEGEKSPREITLRLKRDMFPFIPGRHNLVIDQLNLLFDSPDGKPGANMIVGFLENHTDEQKDFEEEKEEGEVTNIACIASLEWPDLYHGTLNLAKPKVIKKGYRNLGIFQFPAKSNPISRAYLFFSYHILEDLADSGSHNHPHRDHRDNDWG